jgi:xylulose-5-phosphate/fructose-6-phosphate phosphoketolase
MICVSPGLWLNPRLSSHISARIPGCIPEGGELSYVLSVVYGTVMNKPELITIAVIGDGEAEIGLTAT